MAIQERQRIKAPKGKSDPPEAYRMGIFRERLFMIPPIGNSVKENIGR
jgi:hypothetical protein